MEEMVGICFLFVRFFFYKLHVVWIDYTAFNLKWALRQTKVEKEKH